MKKTFWIEKEKIGITWVAQTAPAHLFFIDYAIPGESVAEGNFSFRRKDGFFFLSETSMNHFQRHWKIRLNQRKQQNSQQNCCNYEESGVLGMFHSQSSVFDFLES